jgi:flagellin
MTVRINSNIAFSRARKQFNQLERDSQVRRSRIASGMNINTSSDDGGRLSASEGMRAELHGLTEGARNTEGSLDLLHSAEGGMSEISAMLVRMRELAVQASNATLNDRNRDALDAEFGQLKEYIDRVAKTATYNGHSLLSGFGNTVNAELSTALTDSATTGVQRIKLFGADEGAYTFTDNPGDNTLTLGNGTTSQTISFGSLLVDGQIATGSTLVANFDQLGIQVDLNGANVTGAAGSYADGDLNSHTAVVETGVGGSFQLGSDALPADRIDYDIRDMTVSGSVVNLAGASVGTQGGARNAITQIDGAIQRTAKERGMVGAVINRLEYTVNSTANAIENLKSSESTIRDADFAWETSRLARNDILSQGSVAAMLKSSVPIEMIMDLLAQ